MNIHVIQQVPFEGPGFIEEWATQHNHNLSNTFMHNFSSFPDPDKIDILVIMGGPMGIYDETDYPWLKAEKEFIEEIINQNKRVLGICLGAQLLADILGSKVYPNTQKEIGWFDIEKVTLHPLTANLPQTLTAFHWHGDTFNLPAEAIHLFSSAACRNQGFLYKETVLALQFHFEVTPNGIENLVNNCRSELIKNNYIQSESEILEMAHLTEKTKQYLFTLLDKFIDMGE